MHRVGRECTGLFSTIPLVLFKYLFYFYLMCTGVLPACMSARQILWNSSYSYELPCEYWVLNLGPLEEQTMFLIIKPPLPGIVAYIYNLIIPELEEIVV